MNDTEELEATVVKTGSSEDKDSESKKVKAVPSTGDNTNIALYITMMLGVIIIASVGVYVKANKETKKVD